MKQKKKVLLDKETGEIMQTPIVYTPLSARHRIKKLEKNTMVSETVPDQSMTIAEMIKRHRQGLPIEGRKGLYKEGDEPLLNMDHMDMVERQEYIDSVADAFVDVKTRINAAVKTKEEAALLDKIDAEVRKRLKEIRDRNEKKENENKEE